MMSRPHLSDFPEQRPPQNQATTGFPRLSGSIIETYGYTRYSRLILHEEQSFRGLPVNTDSTVSPLDRGILEALHERHCLAVLEFGTSAVMVRYDWKAGVSQVALSDLMTRLQNQAGRTETKVHFMIVAEFEEGQVGNHYHSALWFDESKLDYPRQVNALWKKVRKAHELPDSCRIIWRRNKNRPYRFLIGQGQDELQRAFYAASYLAKTSQPPLTSSGRKSRITSRVRKMETFRPRPKTCFQLIFADELENSTRPAGEDARLARSTPEFQGGKRLIPPTMTARSSGTFNFKKSLKFQGKEKIMVEETEAMNAPDGEATKEVEATQKKEKKLTPLKAIRLKCLDCCCGSSREVSLCSATKCPQWPLRFGKNLSRKKITLSDQQKLELIARLNNVKECRTLRLSEAIIDTSLVYTSKTHSMSRG